MSEQVEDKVRDAIALVEAHGYGVKKDSEEERPRSQIENIIDVAHCDLPRGLRGARDSLALGLDLFEGFSVIEIENCYDEDKKEFVFPEVHRLIVRANTYVEHQGEMARIIGRTSFGASVVDLYGRLVIKETVVPISIYRGCYRLSILTGLPIVDRELVNIDELIDQLVDESIPAITLR